MGRFEAGLRRATLPDATSDSDPELVARIRAEIQAGGPITFARFMERALYEPDLGYYRSDSARAGRAGDFLTAPEMHPVFGRLVARQLDELWGLLGRPDRFVVREPGAGGGTLAAAILDGLAAEGSALAASIRYRPADLEERRLAATRERLANAGHLAVLEPPDDRPIVGCVLGNEVLDALPVHRVEGRAGRLHELYVDWDGESFVELAGAPSTPALESRLSGEGIVLVDGQRAEICLAVDGWIGSLAAGLARGIILLVDYGYTAAELYSPRRMAGTLLAYRGQRVLDDPFANVGRQDLTAHVDVTAVERAAARSNLARIGVTTQAEFLVGLGLEELLIAAQAEPATTLASYLELRSAVGRLLDPTRTGRFRVMGFGRGLPDGATLAGFGFRLDDRPAGRRRPGSTPRPPD